jgi:hypothetical protein
MLALGSVHGAGHEVLATAREKSIRGDAVVTALKTHFPQLFPASASAGGGGPLYIASASSGFLDTTATRVARLNLPAGTYLLNLNVYTFAQFGSGPITCRIDATTTDTSDAITISSSVNQGRGMMGRSQSITVVTQRDVDANGFSLNGGSSSMLGLIIMGGTFTAVQVSSVITQ